MVIILIILFRTLYLNLSSLFANIELFSIVQQLWNEMNEMCVFSLYHYVVVCSVISVFMILRCFFDCFQFLFAVPVNLSWSWLLPTSLLLPMPIIHRCIVTKQWHKSASSVAHTAAYFMYTFLLPMISNRSRKHITCHQSHYHWHLPRIKIMIVTVKLVRV